MQMHISYVLDQNEYNNLDDRDSFLDMKWLLFLGCVPMVEVCWHYFFEMAVKWFYVIWIISLFSKNDNFFRIYSYDIDIVDKL